VTVEVSLRGAGGTYSGQTVDVSATGSLLWITDESFLSPTELANMVIFSERVAQEFGNGLVVEFAGGEIVREAEVVRVSRKGDDETTPMLVACRFGMPLAGDDWVLLGVAPPRAKRSPASPAGVVEPSTGEEAHSGERRSAPRVERVVWLEVRSDYGVHRAFALNISTVGILLTLADPQFEITSNADKLMNVTKRLGFMFRNGMAIRFLETDLTVEADLVRVSERSEQGEVLLVLGARFRRPLSTAEWSLFGGAASPEPARRAPAPAKKKETPPPAPAPSVVAPRPRRRPGPPGMLEPSPRLRGGGPPRVRIHELMQAAVEAGASDLHLKAGSPVRLRVEGKLKDFGDEPLDGDDVHAMALSLMTRVQVERYEAGGDLELACSFDRIGRFRVSVLRERGQTSLAVRCIPASIPTIESLELVPIVRTLAERPRGLVLVTGPTGSGKSHTLAAMVHHINSTRACHILTMEDPIEFLHPDEMAHITQREIGRDCVDFPTALRRALRHDPDVILVGEMRDRETISLALTAAETGHLVFATLHTSSASQCPDRIIDVFPEGQQEQIRTQLSESLQGILSQILVDRAGGGLVVVQEILVATDAVRALIREGKTPQLYNVMQTGGREGMRTLEAALNEYVATGIITYDTAVKAANQSEQIVRAKRRE